MAMDLPTTLSPIFLKAFINRFRLIFFSSLCICGLQAQIDIPEYDEDGNVRVN